MLTCYYVIHEWPSVKVRRKDRTTWYSDFYTCFVSLISLMHSSFWDNFKPHFKTCDESCAYVESYVMFTCFVLVMYKGS